MLLTAEHMQPRLTTFCSMDICSALKDGCSSHHDPSNSVPKGPMRVTDKTYFHHAQLALDTLRRPAAFGALVAPPIDVEVVPNFGGTADRIQAWLIFSSRDEVRQAETIASAVRSHARKLLVDAGFPADAAATFVLSFVSTAEIDERGGRLAFFR
jgi:hypothetical protein